jgi:hypothetical protein
MAEACDIFSQNHFHSSISSGSERQAPSKKCAVRRISLAAFHLTGVSLAVSPLTAS